jgi:hypothetical protein
MSNLLIGSSNVARFFDAKAHAHSTAREYNMIKCTNIDAFMTHMEGIGSNCEMVLISVIENFLVDKVGNKTDEIDLLVDECVKTFLNSVAKASLRLPSTKFGIVMPMGRPAVTWFHNRVGDIANFITSGINHLDSVNVGRIECCPPSTQQFDQDQIHLTPSAGKFFVEGILSQAEKFFSSKKRGGSSSERSDDQVLEDRLKKIENQLIGQEKTNFENNLLLARIREDQDTATNVKREDRLIITGIKMSDPLPTDARLRVEALKKVAVDIFEKLIPSFQGKISFVNLGKGKTVSAGPMMLEVKLDSSENASAIRKAFAEKRSKKELPESWSSLFITNCVNLATRIRINIMKAIARKVTNKKELAYISGFISRPMMHIKAAPVTTNSKPLRSFTFSDAVSRFGNLLRMEDLDAAYSRVGNAFVGQVAQNFVVLNNQDHDHFRSGASGAPGSSSYRSDSDYSRGRFSGGARGSGYKGPRGGSKRAGDEMRGQNDKHKKY